MLAKISEGNRGAERIANTKIKNIYVKDELLESKVIMTFKKGLPLHNALCYVLSTHRGTYVSLLET